MNIDFAEIIKALKELGRAQFFLILFLLTAGFLIYMFQEPLVDFTKKVFQEEKRIEFREIRNLKGLEVALDSMKSEYAIEGYAVYIYQPKEFAYYKKMILTDYDLIKSVMSLQGIYLDEQLYLNEALLNNEYVLLNEEEINDETAFYHAVGFKSLMVKRLMFNGKIIGEVYLIFYERPDSETVKEISKNITQLNYKYVL